MVEKDNRGDGNVGAMESPDTIQKTTGPLDDNQEEFAEKSPEQIIFEEVFKSIRNKALLLLRTIFPKQKEVIMKPIAEEKPHVNRLSLILNILFERMKVRTMKDAVDMTINYDDFEKLVNKLFQMSDDEIMNDPELQPHIEEISGF